MNYFRINGSYNLNPHPKFNFLSRRDHFPLTRRIEIQKEKMSIEEIRRELWRVQFSVLKDHKNDTTYRVPSRATIATKRIYQTFGLVRNEKIRAMI